MNNLLLLVAVALTLGLLPRIPEHRLGQLSLLLALVVASLYFLSNRGA